MSTVDVRPVHKVADRADYLQCGVGAKRLIHRAAGTDRLAVMFCSAGSIDAFVERGEALAEQYGRTVQAQAYLQNFERVEFDVDKTEDLQRVNDLGFMLAQRMHPHSDVLVVTHDDADGGHAHNHVVVLNHDNKSGRALKKYRTHGSVKKVNDALMREEGLRTAADRQHELALGLEPGSKIPEPAPKSVLAQELIGSVRVSQATYWARKHGKLAADEQSWDERLADAITETMLEAGVTGDDSLRSRLQAVVVEATPAGQQGIAMITDPQHGGTLFEMWDIDLGARRRRSASKISPKLTTRGRASFFTEKVAQVQVTRPSTADMYARAMAGVDMSSYTPAMDIKSIYREQRTASMPLIEPAPVSLSRSETNAPEATPVPVARDAVRAPDPAADEVSRRAAVEEPCDSPTAEEPTIDAASGGFEAEHASRLRSLRGRDERAQLKLDLLIELDESWAQRLVAGERVDATFEHLATRAGVGRALLDGRRGQLLHPAVRGQLETRELAKAAKDTVFEWAKNADGDDFSARMARHKRVRDAIKDGDYARAIRLMPTAEAEAAADHAIAGPAYDAPVAVETHPAEPL